MAASDGRGRWAGTLDVPSALVPRADRPYVLEYRLWGETRSGAQASAIGSERVPLRVLIESQSISRWYRKWWLWTLVGTAVAASVVVPAVVLTRPTNTDVILGSPGR
jgi:hypothetical protein